MLHNDNESMDSGVLPDLTLEDILANASKQEKDALLRKESFNTNDDMSGLNATSKSKELEAVYDIPVQVTAVLGTCTMPVHKLLKLGRGAVVELDRRIGEAVDIYVNNRLIARGEVVIVGEHIGITMTEIVKSDRS